jgi:hypothetical protein
MGWGLRGWVVGSLPSISRQPSFSSVRRQHSDGCQEVGDGSRNQTDEVAGRSSGGGFGEMRVAIVSVSRKGDR